MSRSGAGKARVLAICLGLSAALGSAVMAQGVDWRAADLAQTQAGAKQGLAEAQYALALRLQDGDGLLQNYALAAEWLALAAQQGHAGAANRVGQYYHKGLGVDQDLGVAIAWLEQAAQSGEKQFQFDLALVLETAPQEHRDEARAASLYQAAAEQGLVDASVSLGVLYQNGTGVPRDLARAKALYEGPAAQGHPRAQNNLGLMYVRGEGVLQDYERAFDLFNAASEQGLSVAIGNLAVMYENGFGTQVNEARAAELYKLAARGGDGSGGQTGAPKGPIYDSRLAPADVSPEGLKRLENAVRAGDPVAEFMAAWLILQYEAPTQQELRQSAQLFRASAQAGYPAAMANLGLMYFEGRALPQDYALGYMWLVLASTAGLPEARSLAAELEHKMTSEQVAEAQNMAQARAGQ